MNKSFQEVFSTLKLNQEMADLMATVEVEKVVSTKRRDVIKVYLLSHNLITYEEINALTDQMYRQMFSKMNVAVSLIIRFELSAQYTAENLFGVYRESMLAELRDSKPVLFTMLNKAEFSFSEESEVLIRIPDLTNYRDRENEFLLYLDKVFYDRCGIKVRFCIDYVEAKQEDRRTRKAYNDVYSAAVDTNREMVAEGSPAEGENYDDPDRYETDREDEYEGSDAKRAKSWNAEEAALAEQAASVREAASKDEDSKNGKDDKKHKERPLKTSKNPDVIIGKDVVEDAMSIADLEEDMLDAVIRGVILIVEFRPIRNEKTICSFTVTDYNDTIKCKQFLRNDQVAEVEGVLKPGLFVKVKGRVMMDKFDHEVGMSFLNGVMKINDFTVKREDHAEKKRVELHCHTKMSDMDGVSDAKTLIKAAHRFGMPALAITDHGDVQAFPEVNHALEDLKLDSFKPIYGVEGYIVDDYKQVVTKNKDCDVDNDYVVFDLETTGFSPVTNRIIEIGAVKIHNGEIVDRFSEFVNPKVPIPFRIEQLTSINDSMVENAEPIEVLFPRFVEFCQGCVLVGHNVAFDISFIEENGERLGMPVEYTTVDTVGISRMFLPQLGKHTLDAVAKELKIVLDHHHRAVDDAECTALIFLKFLQMMKEREITKLETLNEMSKLNVKSIQRMPTYHCILLAKNDIGRVNLYKLVSESHLTYYARHPRMPKTLIDKYREGLIIGSACEAGELYRALLDGKSEKEIARIVSFYDYLEIQPVGNNRFMIQSDKIENVNSEEDIRKINKEIVALGEKFNKPVVATCDVHFCNPEDEVYRRIIMAGQGFDDADNQAPLYLHTTDEMLEEFGYLGAQKAEEVVITNTNKIADMVEYICPVRPDKCAPVIPNSDQLLTDICYRKAHEMYGETLPEIVEARLERELNSIIKNGFAVMYIIAQKLVWKSVEDGYLVGSRGSVGSSFVATMAGITEVNPLSPHYYCGKCHYSDFDSPEVKAYAGTAGCDMPDKQCPVCGSNLIKDGFDIPFETFLGFKGDKEPDIDLNFSGEYQSKAHKYTEVIFGAGQTFRAGTIGALADKTAFGYVKKYYEERGQHKRNCEIDRIVQGCVGVRRTTGQHPGGIVVLPFGEEINTFTPVQHPANDMTTDTITTHFDYHSIDHNLLKLDILGHDDPTMIRMLEDLTGIDATAIPLDDPGVMSLFQDTSALKVTPEEIRGCQLGCLGVPEFGTDFAMQMLIDTKPKHFSDLVRIAGLSHGTDVWLGNAETLIKEGTATISTCICTRDDIMTYLIQMGVEPSHAFSIMENVRKGKVAKRKCKEWDTWKQEMLEHGVPDWYIWSCEKIQYMFPKAHAAAYVMMAWRIAWCKINYPQAYYAAYFSIRAKGFNYELMCQGKKRLYDAVEEYDKKGDDRSNKEDDTFKDLRICQEMYARGYEFMPIDLFKVKSRDFQIIDGKVMPSLSSIEGLGEKAADSIVEAAKNGPFLSRDDFRERAKVGKSTSDLLKGLGILSDLPESNQLSLFDL